MSLKGDNSHVSYTSSLLDWLIIMVRKRRGKVPELFKGLVYQGSDHTSKISGPLGNSLFALLIVFLNVFIRIHSENCCRFKEIK